MAPVANELELAALLVAADDERRVRRGPRRLERGAQLPDLLGRGHVSSPEERDPGSSAFPDGGQDLGPGREPVERAQEANAGQRVGECAGVVGSERRSGGLGRHPFTAPAVSPPTILFWTIRKNSRTGSVNRVEAAIVAPQSVPKLVRNEASQTGSV